MSEKTLEKKQEGIILYATDSLGSRLVETVLKKSGIELAVVRHFDNNHGRIMLERKENNKGKIAKRDHFATDQGTGGSTCSNCHYDLGPDPSVDYKNCPKCNYTLIRGEMYIQQGGSDF